MIDFRKSLWPVDALGLLACGLLTATALGLTAGPIQRERDQHRVRRADLEAKRQLERDLDTTRERIEQQLVMARSQVAQSAGELKPIDHLNTRLAAVAALVESCGMVIHGSELSEARPDRWFRVVPLTVSGAGTFPQCAAFLHKMHVQLPDVGLAGLRMTGNPAEGEEPARFQFDLLWYAAPRPPAGGDS